MPELMRARHDVYGVADVPDTDFYRENGWSEVDPSTPTAADERRAAVNAARRGELTERPAAEVVAAVQSLPEPEREQVAAAEKAGKARKSVLDAAKDD